MEEVYGTRKVEDGIGYHEDGSKFSRSRVRIRIRHGIE